MLRCVDTRSQLLRPDLVVELKHLLECLLEELEMRLEVGRHLDGEVSVLERTLHVPRQECLNLLEKFQIIIFCSN